MRERFDSLDPARRVRAAAIVVSVASAGHLVLLRIVPSQLAPALPKALWLLVAATAAVAAVWPHSVIAAWQTSALRRRRFFAWL